MLVTRILLFSFIILFSCDYNSNLIEIRIRESLYYGDSIQYVLYNRTTNPVLFYENMFSYRYKLSEHVNDKKGLTINFFENDSLLEFDSNLYQFPIYVHEDSISIYQGNLENKYNEIDSYYIKKYNTIFDTDDPKFYVKARIRDNSKVLNPNDSLSIKIFFTEFGEESQFKFGSVGPLNKTNENITVSLTMHSDSINAKSYMDDKLIDSLRRNKIKIFHGTITSNKVPLVFKEE